MQKDMECVGVRQALAGNRSGRSSAWANSTGLTALDRPNGFTGRAVNRHARDCLTFLHSSQVVKVAQDQLDLHASQCRARAALHSAMWGEERSFASVPAFTMV